MRRRILLVFAQRIPICADGLGKLTDSSVSQPQVVMCLRVGSAPRSDGSGVCLDRVLDLAFGVVCGTEPEVGFGKVGRLLERLALRADRLLELSLAEICETEVVISFGELTIALIQSGPERLNRSVEIAHLVKRSSQTSKNSRKD